MYRFKTRLLLASAAFLAASPLFIQAQDTANVWHPVPTAAPPTSNPANATMVVHAGSPACDCNQGVRQTTPNRKWWKPQRLWLTNDRPILIDEQKFRYEPRIRDIRFAPMSSTLPGGNSLGAPDTLPVLPAYRDGYIRFFSFR